MNGAGLLLADCEFVAVLRGVADCELRILRLLLGGEDMSEGNNNVGSSKTNEV